MKLILDETEDYYWVFNIKGELVYGVHKKQFKDKPLHPGCNCSVCNAWDFIRQHKKLK